MNVCIIVDLFSMHFECQVADHQGHMPQIKVVEHIESKQITAEVCKNELQKKKHKHQGSDFYMLGLRILRL